MLRTALLLTALLALGVAAPAVALPPTDPDTRWIADGDVDALAVDGQTLYLGGDFDRLNRRTGGGVRLSTPAGEILDGPEFDSTVYASIPDGAGGFYVGGPFVHAGGAEHHQLAHVLADGTVDPAFNAPLFNQDVLALALRGDTLYVGGRFFSNAQVQRSGLAALDAETGALRTDFAPRISGNSGGVFDLELSADGGTLYAVGSFLCAGAVGGTNTCGDVPGEDRRLNAAAFATDDGALLGWQPNASSSAHAIDRRPGSSSLVIGGAFLCVRSLDSDCNDADPDQSTRRGIAEVDGVTGDDTTFNPRLGIPGTNSSAVHDLIAEPDGSVTIVGEFTCARFNGDADCTDATEVARERALRVTGVDTVTAWNPHLTGGRARTIAHVPNGPYWIGGDFTTAGGQPRERVVAVDAATGAPLAAHPRPDGGVHALAYGGEHVFMGGSFDGAGGIARHNLAAIDLQTGEPTAFDPSPDEGVLSLAVAHGRLYAGGWFENVAGAPRKSLAAFDLPTGALSPWAPAGADGDVNAIATDAERVYVGGNFKTIGGATQTGLAALRADDATATPGFPAVDGYVNALAIGEGRLFVGGNFEGAKFGGEDRRNLGAIDLATGQVAGWAPRADERVYALAAAGGKVYAGGIFQAIDGAERPVLAALDAQSGALLDWDAGLGTGDAVVGLSPEGDTLAVAGDLGQVNGQMSASDVVLLDTADGRRRPWDPQIKGDAHATILTGGALYAGGGFLNAGALTHEHLATFTPAPAPLAAPSLRSVPLPGAGVECDPGRWEGNAVLATSWLLRGAPVSDAPVFTPSDGDAGALLGCRVTARNIRGEATADSAAAEIAGKHDQPVTKPAEATTITLAAATGKGVRKTRSGRYVVRYGSSLRVLGTVRGTDRVSLLRGRSLRSLIADTAGRFAMTYPRPARALRVTAAAAGATAELRALVVAALRSTTARVQRGAHVRISGRIAVPKVKGGAGKLVVRRAGKTVATLRIRRSGRFAVKLAQKPGRALYRVRFAPRKGSGLAPSSVRVAVKRP
jgi:hypothetical protein